MAIDYNVPLVTNNEQIKKIVECLEKNPTILNKSYCEYFDL